MNYQIGTPGRIVVAKFDDGDKVLENLAEIARKENIRAAVFHLVGAMKKGRFVVGPKTDEMPPVPVWRELGESHEIVGIGTIFWYEGEPRVHYHGAFAKGDHVSVGCLREKSETFIVLEAVILEINGVRAERELDPASGMVLLRV